MYVKSKRRHTQLQRRIDKYHLRNEVIAGDGNLRMLLLIGNDGCSGQYTSDVMCGTDAETDFRRHSEYKVLHNLFSLSYFFLWHPSYGHIIPHISLVISMPKKKQSICPAFQPIMELFVFFSYAVSHIQCRNT